MAGDDLPFITSDELRTKRLAHHALLVGDTPDTRLVFIRKGSPLSLATKSLVGIFDQRLKRVASPILSFDSTFDLILYGNDACIFNQANLKDSSRKVQPCSPKPPTRHVSSGAR